MTNKKKILVFIICVFIIWVIIPAGFRIIHLYNNKDYYGFPAITQCRICNKTVWEWQSYERRNFTVRNTGTFHPCMSATGIVHKHCKGNPVFEVNVTTK